MSQTPNAETLASEEWVPLDRKRDTAPDRDRQRIQSIHRSLKTQARELEIGEKVGLDPLIGAVPRCLTSGDEHGFWEDSNDRGRRYFRSQQS